MYNLDLSIIDLLAPGEVTIYYGIRKCQNQRYQSNAIYLTHGGITWSYEECTLWCLNYCNVYNTNECILHRLLGVVYIAIVKTLKSAFFT